MYLFFRHLAGCQYFDAVGATRQGGVVPTAVARPCRYVISRVFSGSAGADPRCVDAIPSERYDERCDDCRQENHLDHEGVRTRRR